MKRDYQEIQWLFFDIGSTLVDEDKAYEARIKTAISGKKISYQLFYDKMLSYFKENKKGDLEALNFYGLERPAWRTDLETLYPQTKEILDQLGQEYKLGIIANQLPGLEERLKDFGILDYFSAIFSSADLGLAKPDPAIFRLALQKTNCLPQQAIMIGDRLDNDIVPARRIGMKTIWIKQGFGRLAQVKNLEEGADWTVEKLTDLLPILLS